MKPLQLFASEFKTDDQTFVDSNSMALFFLMVWYNAHSEEYMPWSYQLHCLFGTVNEAEHDAVIC